MHWSDQSFCADAFGFNLRVGRACAVEFVARGLAMLETAPTCGVFRCCFQLSSSGRRGWLSFWETNVW
eukprot:1613555-Rhodomonas_salina.1